MTVYFDHAYAGTHLEGFIFPDEVEILDGMEDLGGKFKGFAGYAVTEQDAKFVTAKAGDGVVASYLLLQQ